MAKSFNRSGRVQVDVAHAPCLPSSPPSPNPN
ncbi:uncharacterized protein G2W53_023488 [Senna tora]|uniref:Uncharacterized protein n=1 Tax=Senna tora TaxID=362788 RepID=A0A834T977_9FABA|nr:uncharacterized protein G2W53_023488 [Senna tora]